MKIAMRRRLAVASALSLVATVGAVVGMTGTSSASSTCCSADPQAVGNYPSFTYGAVIGQPQKVTFTAASPISGGVPIPAGSDVHWSFSGDANNSFDSRVETNTSPTGSKPQTTVDFSDVDDPTTTGAPAGAGTGQVGGTGPADPGAYDVSFRTHPDPGTGAPSVEIDSCTGCVTVVAAGPPSVSTATPNKVAASAGTAKVTFKGANFARNSKFAITPSTGNATTDVKIVRDDTSSSPGTPTPDGTTWYALVTVPPGAALGVRDIQVTNPGDGQTTICTGCFTVLGSNLTSVSPTGATNNDTDSARSIRFTGQPGAVASDAKPSLQFVGDPGTVSRDSLTIPGTVTAQDGSSITATYNLSQAAPGNNVYQPQITSAGGNTINVCGCRFTVLQTAAPTVTSVNPSSQNRGTSQQVTVTGTNFSKGANVLVPGGGVTATAIDYVSRTQLKATLAVDAAATPGKRDLQVKRTDGQTATLTVGYTINTATGGPSPTPTPTGSANTCPTSSASPTRSSSPSATSTPSATATATTSPSSSASSSASASPTATATGTCEQLTLAVNPADIVPNQASVIKVHGSPSQAVQVWAYSRPSTTYTVVRSGTTDASGNIAWSVTPGGNTRLYAHYTNGASTAPTDSLSAVITVHTSLSLSSYRDGPGKYHFQGTNLPRRAGQLITLYRYAKGPKQDQYCVPTAESDTFTKDDAGCTAIRTATAFTNSSNTWRIDRTFSGAGRFYFVVRTSKTNDNGRGHSNQRLTIIH